MMDVQAVILLQCSIFDASERRVQGELVTIPHCGTVGASSRGRPSRRRPPTQVRLKFVVSGTSLMVPKPAPRGDDVCAYGTKEFLRIVWWY